MNMPFCREVVILSRLGSAVTSRSNRVMCSRTMSVSRTFGVVEWKDRVTKTKVTPARSKMRAGIPEETRMRALTLSPNGIPTFTNAVRPIVNPEDMAGPGIRTMQSPAFMETVNSLGASATPIRGAEVPLSRQQLTS